MGRPAKTGPIIPTPFTDGYRAKMSKTLAKSLGWTLEEAAPYPFKGYFRTLGELIVAPENLRLEPVGEEPARHPLDDYFDLAQEVAATAPTGTLNARDLAETAYLTAGARCRTFEATWANDSQLFLNLNLSIAQELGWGRDVEPKPFVYLVPRGGLLLILSNSRYEEVRKASLEKWLHANV